MGVCEALDGGRPGYVGTFAQQKARFGGQGGPTLRKGSFRPLGSLAPRRIGNGSGCQEFLPRRNESSAADRPWPTNHVQRRCHPPAVDRPYLEAIQLPLLRRTTCDPGAKVLPQAPCQVECTQIPGQSRTGEPQDAQFGGVKRSNFVRCKRFGQKHAA
jgi:hypothetical protein